MNLVHIGILSMTSQEIADLVEKRHDNVRRTIETLAAQGVIEFPQIEEIPTTTKPTKAYRFNGEQGKRDSIIVVAQLSPEFTARLVDRWQELEAKQPGPVIPQSLPEALRLAADLAERNDALALERDEAVRTKAQIGSRREATALARASAERRKVLRLENQLGFGRHHATIVAVERKLGEAFPWLPLRRWCKANGMSPIDVDDKRYGTVKAWPALAWQAVYDIDLAELFESEAAI